MARVNSKLIELTGKIAGLVFYKSIYGNLARAKPESTGKKRKSSKLQKYQQNKLQVVMDFLKPLKRLLRENIFLQGSDLPPFHWAKSYYLNEVVYFDDGRYHINWPKALMSVGNLRPPELLSAHIDGTYLVQLQWQDNSDQALAYPDDELLVVLCAPGAKTILYKTGVAKRKDEGVTITLNQRWEGVETHLWAGFSQPGKQASVSLYLGSFAL